MALPDRIPKKEDDRYQDHPMLESREARPVFSRGLRGTAVRTGQDDARRITTYKLQNYLTVVDTKMWREPHMYIQYLEQHYCDCKWRMRERVGMEARAPRIRQSGPTGETSWGWTKIRRDDDGWTTGEVRELNAARVARQTWSE